MHTGVFAITFDEPEYEAGWLVVHGHDIASGMLHKVIRFYP